MTTVRSTTRARRTVGTAAPSDPSGAPPAPPRGPGRPRDPETDQAILKAAIEVMEEMGLRGTTVSAVAERAGVARATVYLRWPTRERLLGAMVRASGGGEPYPLSGNLDADIRRGAEFAREVTAGEHFVAMLPELIAAVMENPAQLNLDDVAPNRRRLAAEYRALAGEQGFDSDIDPNMVFDLILGAELIQIIAERRAPSARYTRQLAEVVVRGMRAPAASHSEG